MNAIEVEGLHKTFGSVVAVDGLSFDVPCGKVTGFLGPNGAGKSTTLRAILGLVRPDAGRATVLGRPLAALRRPAGTVGALLDTEQFHPRRSGRNHLRVVAAAGGIEEARVDHVLELVGLTEAARRRVGGYSLGMKQRLGLAGALLGDPEVVVLDEPANGLDPAGIRWLRGFLRELAESGRSVFVSSHQLAEVAEMADEVVVIDRGRLVTHSPVGELVHRARGGVRVETGEPERLEELLAGQGLEVARVSPRVLRVAAERDVVGRVAASASIPIFGLEEEERSLEDVFFELTGSQEGGL